MRGEGTDVRVDLNDESQKNVNFGALRIGQSSQKTIKVVNRSKCEASISLSKMASKLKNYSITYTPNGDDIVLKPNQVLPVTINFQPQARIPSFSEKIMAEVAGMAFPLAFIMGMCQGTNFNATSTTNINTQIIHKNYKNFTKISE